MNGNGKQFEDAAERAYRATLDALCNTYFNERLAGIEDRARDNFKAGMVKAEWIRQELMKIIQGED